MSSTDVLPQESDSRRLTDGVVVEHTIGVSSTGDHTLLVASWYKGFFLLRRLHGSRAVANGASVSGSSPTVGVAVQPMDIKSNKYYLT